MGVLLQRSLYSRKAAANLSVAIEVTTPYKLFFEVALDQQVACQL
jgi:hypothetical protein